MSDELSKMIAERNWEHRERMRLDMLRADLVAERDSNREEITALRAALAEALDGWELWNRSYNVDTGSGSEVDPRIAELRAKHLEGR